MVRHKHYIKLANVYICHCKRCKCKYYRNKSVKKDGDGVTTTKVNADSIEEPKKPISISTDTEGSTLDADVKNDEVKPIIKIILLLFSILLLIIACIFISMGIYYLKTEYKSQGSLFMLIGILCLIGVALVNLMWLKNLFFNLLAMFFTLCIYVPTFFGIVAAKIIVINDISKPLDAKYYFPPILSFITMFSFIGLFLRLIYLSKHNLYTELCYLNVVIQIGVSFLTVIGVIINEIEELVFKDFKIYYFALLLVYLAVYLYAQFLLVYVPKKN